MCEDGIGRRFQWGQQEEEQQRRSDRKSAESSSHLLLNSSNSVPSLFSDVTPTLLLRNALNRYTSSSMLSTPGTWMDSAVERRRARGMTEGAMPALRMKE